QTITDGVDRWGFPKGHANQSETIIDAAFRELVEEVGICMTQVYLLPYIPFEQSFEDLGLHYKEVFFFAEYTGNTQIKIDMSNESQISEIDNICWFSLNELKLPIINYCRRIYPPIG